MHRKTVHRWIAALALVAALGVMGAQPAAAAEQSGIRATDQLASLWSAVSAAPAALWEFLSGWVGATEKSTIPPPPPNEGAGWTLDPNGGSSGGS